MNQYAWLEGMAVRIRTDKFCALIPQKHPESVQLLEPDLGADSEYLGFRREWSSVHFFRHEISGWYWLIIYAQPEIAAGEAGEELLKIARFSTDEFSGTPVYLKRNKKEERFSSEIFEGYSWQLKNTHKKFDAWFEFRFQIIKKKWGTKRWKQVLEGPPPFSDEERKIAEAYSSFHWKVDSITDPHTVNFEVSNESSISLPALTAKWSWKTECLMTLKVANVAPGQTKVITEDFSAYKTAFNAYKVEFIKMPRPGPEDRSIYRELESLQVAKKRSPRSRKTPTQADTLPDRPYKEIWDISISDLLENPVWVNLDVVGMEDALGASEASMTPVPGNVTVDPSMGDCVILLRNLELNLYFMAIFQQPQNRLVAISAFLNDRVFEPMELSQIKTPLELISVPEILGIRDCTFICTDLSKREAIPA